MKRFAGIAATSAFAVALALAGCGSAAPGGSSTPLTAQNLGSASSASSVSAAESAASASDEPAEDAAAEAAQDTGAEAAAGIDAASVESTVKDQVAAYARDVYGMSGDVVAVANIVAVDAAESGSAKALGCFAAFAFSEDDGTFVMQSASVDTGAVLLSGSAEAGYQAAGVEYAEDGAGRDESLQQICGGNSSAYEQLASINVSDDELKAAVAEYVQANGLDVTAYETSSGERVEL